MAAPKLGQLVHYRSYGTPGGEWPSECRAAFVTEVIDVDTVSLLVFNPTGAVVAPAADHNEAQVPATWHWPCD